MSFIRNSLPGSLWVALLIAPPTSAQDAFYGQNQAEASPVRFFAGVGLANIKAGEYVYQGDYKVSQLDWESKGVKTGTIGAELELGYKWRLKGRLDVGLGGNGHMVDRDWLLPSIDDWTHQSIHPDTGLDRYINLLIEADRSLINTGSSRVALGGGIGFTDVKWTARGGSYIYSTFSLHDTVGNFADGEKGISYEQRIPTLFLSANAEQSLGRFTLSGTARGGASVGFKGIDDHWMRDLRFTDDILFAPMVGATVTADYQLLANTSLYVSGDFQKVFTARGDSTVRDTNTGATAEFDDAGKGDFQSIALSVGVKGSF
ncbi:omptin family outer membrane protease [Peteryoungia ipomoeae]|uniref:Omptin family outer membrane protease n=1 Tax=Peteryoungia ipomoeae TaxID=1210932 RepID=A0A4S8P605_9HYPH|nr:omptin family outer membrane protease [Peteryoungia ipomoeae]THV25650.1 omptin family outer membrane protease [Peteryoungia ipomoeae]